MNKNILLFFVSILSFSLYGQVGDICAGERLVDPIFSEVQITESVQFGVGESALFQEYPLLMDVYEPVGDDLDQRPVVVMAHGGSFIAGDRKNQIMVETCTALAKRGYVAASIEYTLWPIVLGFPDSTDLIDIITRSIGDMKTAVRFFNEDGLNDNVYKVNPGLISVGGYSAGAIIACNLGMLDAEDTLSEFVQNSVDNRGGFENLGSRLDYSDEVISIINFSGSIYNLDFIDENSAPIYSSHGNVDATVPYNFGLTGGIMTSHGSGNIQVRYDSLGLESELYTIEGGGHTDIFTEAQFQDDIDAMFTGLYAWNKDQVCSIVTSSKDLVATTAEIYPNPTNKELNVIIPAEIGASYTIELYNQIGQLMYTSQSFNDPRAQINVSGMTNGMYLAKINFDEEYQTISKRIVVAK